MSDIATILITMPLKKGDPTEYTHMWAKEAVKISKNLGYKTVAIERDDTTYENVSNAIKKYRPRLVTHFGHGCPSSLQGNKECILARKFSVDELICMAEGEDPHKKEILLKMLNPLGQLSCPGICSLNNDPCSLYCQHDTNVGLLKDTITLAVACHSALQLGTCAIKYGAETYIGYTDLMMFPVDSLKTENIFGNIQLSIFKEILVGNTVQEANHIMSDLEDFYIRKYKKVKYIALPMLWNRIHREVLGDKNAMIY